MPGKGLAARSSASSAAVRRGYRLYGCGVGWCARTPDSAQVHECVSWVVFALGWERVLRTRRTRSRVCYGRTARASLCRFVVLLVTRPAVDQAPRGFLIFPAVLSAGDLFPAVVTTAREASKGKRGSARSGDEGIRRRPDGVSAPFGANPARWHLSVTDTRSGNRHTPGTIIFRRKVICVTRDYLIDGTV
jgi:hypothetical protein